jgi:[ribosomal protein S5]-alanine N-acetyltransferase
VTGAIAETKRLVLREFVPEHLVWLAPMLGDPETLEHWERPLTVAESEAWIESNRERYARDGYGLWAVELRGGEPLGDCGLVRREIEGEWEVELGYHFGRRFWGNGYATEAATACVERATALGIERLVALILPANVRSQGVARRVGFQPGRELIHAGRPHVLWDSPPLIAS